MSGTLNRLKSLTVEREKNKGRYSDGGGLYLIVKPGPRRSWAFLYRRGTKTTELGLGSTQAISLVAARVEAAELRSVLSAGGDPKAHRERKRQAQALEDARSVTFEKAARRYHERHKAKWHSEQYARQWLQGLVLHAFPLIGNLSVRDVDMAAVLKVLEPIWYAKPRVAQLVRANTESVLDLARAEGQRTTDNPARWDILKHSLPARKGARVGGHFRALPYSDMPALMKALEADASISAVCFRFTILTVARTNESTSCPWPDIDFDARTRGVQILKGGKAWRHMIPLSTQAIELLQGLLVDGKPVGDHVFPAPAIAGAILARARCSTCWSG